VVSTAEAERPSLATGPRVWLHEPTAADRRAFLVASAASAGLHHPWVAPPTDDHGFELFLARAGGETTFAHLVRTIDDDHLVGVINVNNIVRSSFLNGQLGWYAMEGGQGRGFMSEALDLVIGRMFGQQGLHRLEANIQPDNHPSVAMARRLGFRHEGRSARYLYIDGAWRDHERFAITIEDRG
jgi:ribosomal-protein-alanine N-acetyltransferase